MLTINAMVRVGPWTIREVNYSKTWTHCERCNERIKEVWVCEVDSDSDLVNTTLDGQRVWRIGSTCGPTLMDVSNGAWKGTSKDLRSRIQLAKRVLKVLTLVRQTGYEDLPDFVEERFQMLLEGTLPEGLRRHLGLMLTWHERQLGLKR